MQKTAFMFPGQGSQYVGMGKDFYEQYEVSRKIYQEASDIIEMDIAKLCFEENSELNRTEFTQIALFVTEIAMLQALQFEGISSDVNVGLSLGEYSALVTSGVMNFTDACKVVRQRSIFMERAVPAGIGAMVAVIGLSAEVIEEEISKFHQVQIANYNCPGQIVISGFAEEVALAGTALKEKGAKQIIKLNVSGPFHSSMLLSAGEALGKELDSIILHDANVPYVANCTAKYVKEADEVKELLKRQVYSPVMFEQSIKMLLQDGVDRFVEIGPGKSLNGFVKRIDKRVQIITVNKVEDVLRMKELN